MTIFKSLKVVEGMHIFHVILKKIGATGGFQSISLVLPTIYIFIPTEIGIII